MDLGEPGAVARRLQTLFQAGTAAGLSDGELLNRFSGRRDEAAFAALVERHGPMVLRVCRGVLADAHDAEDAFQATFLVLALRAGAVRERDSLACWLFGVARRSASKAKVAAARRRAREHRAATLNGSHASVDSTATEHWPELHDEVARLAENYRAPVVLCYLQGLTHQEAADQLGLPLGTVKIRLTRGREVLRRRLVRRGLAPALLFAASREAVAGPVPPHLIESTIKAVAGASASVAAVVEGVLTAMLISRLKTAAAFLAAALSVLVASVLVVAATAGSDQDPAAARPASPVKRVAVEPVKKTVNGRSTSQIGDVDAFVSVELRPRHSGYLKDLKVDIGAAVTKGQVVAQIDAPELDAERERSRAIVGQAEARLTRAKAAITVAEAAIDAAEAAQRSADASKSAALSMSSYREQQLARSKQLNLKNAVSFEFVDEKEQEVQQARSAAAAAQGELKVAEARTAESKAKLLAARADVIEAEANLRIAQADERKAAIVQAFTIVVSPIDGVVTQRSYHVGDLVRSGIDGQSAPLFTIINTERMRVVTSVRGRDIPFVDIGDKATVTLDALPGMTFEGKVSRFSHSEKNPNRTMRIEVDLDNSRGHLREGMSGVVSILLEPEGEVLSIPSTAHYLEKKGSAACYRLVDGHAARTAIKVGSATLGRVAVQSGLKEGDQVVVSAMDVEDGQAIEPTASSPAK